ncbi:MAG TPA: hypothetical protein VFI72_09810 [Candidatus Angelobacter sp.]|nr:hypothetical protein [Candidatus Angelobacter sp.]
MSQVKSSQIQAGPQNTPDPQLVVTADPAAPLKPGKYTFSLIVTDDLNQTSTAATAVVEVRAAPAVTITGPTVVAFNQDITLNAAVKTTGTIKNYAWSVK